MGQNNDRLLHITVGAHPTKELNLNEEISLIKAALLYADHVKLYSLTSSALGMASRFVSLPLDYKVRILESTIPLISPQNQSKGIRELLRKYKDLSGQKNPTNEDLASREQIAHLLNNSWSSMEDASNEIIRNSKIPELKNAIDSGVLELHTFENANSDEDVANFMIDSITAAVKKSSETQRESKVQDNKLLREFTEEIFKSVSNGSTHPLFDEKTASLVNARAGIAKLPTPRPGSDHEKQTSLAKHLFEYLPTFEKITIDEILDIRKELDRSLTRFRSAVIGFSQEIKSAPWDKDFLPEADKIYYRDIKPALLDIEESVASNKFLMTLLKKFTDKPAVLPATSIFSIAISQFSSLPKELVTGLGISIASASLIYEAYDEWVKKKKNIEQNLLYFYYRIGKTGK